MVLHQITFENRQNIKSLTKPKHLAHFCIFKELLINHHYGGYYTGSCIIFKRKCCFFILFLNKLYEAIIKIKLQQSVGISRPFHTLRIHAVPKWFLLRTRFVSALLSCYPQHKSEQFRSDQKGFRNTFRKVWTTWNGTRNFKSLKVLKNLKVFQ